MKDIITLSRVLIGTGALVLAVSFFMPMVDIFTPYSPMTGLAEMCEDVPSGWRRGDIEEVFSAGGYTVIIALPHIFGLLALVVAVFGGQRAGAVLMPVLLIVWFSAFAVMLGASIWSKGIDSVGGRGWIHFGLAMAVIAFGVPWIRRPLPHWSDARLVQRCMLVGAVTAIAWFTMWAWELDTIHYGLIVAILASVTILVGNLRVSPSPTDT